MTINPLYERVNLIFEKIFTQKPIDTILIRTFVDNYLRTLNEEQLEKIDKILKENNGIKRNNDRNAYTVYINL